MLGRGQYCTDIEQSNNSYFKNDDNNDTTSLYRVSRSAELNSLSKLSLSITTRSQLPVFNRMHKYSIQIQTSPFHVYITYRFGISMRSR